MRKSERDRVEEGGREWENERVRVRKPLRTAKEPAPVRVIIKKDSGTQKKD